VIESGCQCVLSLAFCAIGLVVRTFCPRLTQGGESKYIHITYPLSLLWLKPGQLISAS
jgi:hypothetical protein